MSRAVILYKELRKIRGKRAPHPDHGAVDPQTLARYADWFVLNQVKNLDVPAIAERLHIGDESTVRKGIGLIRRVTGIPKRKRRKNGS